MGPPGQSKPADRPMERARCASIVLADGDTTRARAVSEAQKRAALIQEAHRLCGQRPAAPTSRTPTKLKGLKETDLRPEPKFGRDSHPSDEPTEVPLEALATRPWEVPRVNKDAMRDPYLRAQGLHKNNTILGSHTMKKILNARTFHADDAKVDFNFKYTA
eukprot:CAMPEP_0174827390 /NCGR_PEP_ID=MMETSP1114-20130205/687_1 /TAXON_ID=312471 /ORGANISM="Neobodo designis, Strain CCAP 1951/1" /LENGTH=160 /DNA_ID=CAMNT_0016061031 /DNA_START=115 /DNA_END=597 /DNA_ORIENTATION=+